MFKRVAFRYESTWGHVFVRKCVQYFQFNNNQTVEKKVQAEITTGFTLVFNRHGVFGLKGQSGGPKFIHHGSVIYGFGKARAQICMHPLSTTDGPVGQVSMHSVASHVA